MTHSKAILRWNMVFGDMLSYNWETNAQLDSPWLDLVGTFQRSVSSRYAGQQLARYARTGNLSQSTFGNLTITGNWDTAAPYDTAGHRLAPGGFLAETDDKSVVAGIFVDLFNGNALAVGEHYLVVDRQPAVVEVRQPIGSDTRLTVRAPDSWQTGRGLDIWTLDHKANRLGTVRFSMKGRDVKFNYAGVWKDGERVAAYQIVAR